MKIEDLIAAVNAPIEVDEEPVAVEAVEAKVDNGQPEVRFEEQFLTVARARAREQGAEGHQVFQEICLEYGVTAQDHYEEYCKLAKICYGPIEEHQL